MSVWTIALVLLVAAVLISAARGKVRIGRREVEDLEAKLRPEPGVEAADGAWGGAERETWDDGEAEFEAFVRGLALPDGAPIEFVVEDVPLGRVAVDRGRVRLEYDSRSGDEVPPIAAGQRIEVRHDGVVLLAGRFRHD